MHKYSVIEGETFTDERGHLNYFNAFEMSSIVRFYEIESSKTDKIRAWQGHKKEQKWFYCTKGSFMINIIEVDDFDNPSPKLKPQKIILSARDPKIIQVSGGCATGIKAISKEARLIIFSDFNTDESIDDDFRYPLENWNADWDSN